MHRYVSEFVRADMGSERVRDLQEDDDTEKFGTAVASSEYD